MNLTGINRATAQVVQLINPRNQHSAEHFAWNGCLLVGLSATSRTTIRVLEMNSKDRIRVRLANA